MTTSTTQPLGRVLVSSALSPRGVMTILQPIVAQAMGMSLTDPQTPANVRLEWPVNGQPDWNIDQDICFLRAIEENLLYSKYRDILYSHNDEISVLQTITYQRTWRLGMTFYGPNAFDHARVISDVMFLDWFQEALQASNLYIVPNPDRPAFAPEQYNAQWWDRADFALGLNEQVTAQIVTPSIASSEVILETADGIVADFTVTANQ
jgi:hypothetical protein